MQLTYNNQSLLACGCYEDEDSGLTRFGKQVIKEMNRVGMVIDMSHSAERSTLEAIDYSERPVIVSHANPSHFHPALRNKSNKVIDAVAANEGILGFSLYPSTEKWPSMHARGLLRHGRLDGRENGNRPHWTGLRPLSKPTSKCPEWMRNGRWSKTMDYGEGSSANAGWPESLSWFAIIEISRHCSCPLQAWVFRAELGKIMGGIGSTCFNERPYRRTPAHSLELRQ